MRKEPILTTTFWATEIEFKNGEYHDENGTYKYDKIKYFNFESNDISLVLSAASAILQLTGIDANRFPLRPIPNIKFEYDGKEKRITFNDCIPECVDDFLQEISSRLNKNSNT